MRSYVYRIIAKEISRLTRFSSSTVQLNPTPNDDFLLLNSVDAPKKEVKTVNLLTDDQRYADHQMLLLNGNLNYDLDIQGTLQALNQRLNRTNRIVVVVYNSYMKWLYKLADCLSLRKGTLPEVFLTRSHLENMATISGFDFVRLRPSAYCPFKLFGLGSLINSILPAIPFLRWFSFTSIAVLRPIKKDERKRSLSIVIPARNEKGNIAAAVERLKYFLDRHESEIIFVEGHSTDATWEEILRVQKQYDGVYQIQAFKQTGKGKVDAVRLGFAKARCELLTILDADLTMPPELLYRFYDAYHEGRADMINGSRLVYPMEDDSMRFLNHLGNIFFAKILSFVLDCTVTDSLCGTKLLSKADYDRLIRWREHFGDFDPFGDFELIFPSASLGLGIVDIPIRYRSRTYGSTNIHRFRHGLILLKMTMIGFFKIKSSP